MTEKHLHIISFDVPYPADYGGVIDVFYKIKALHKIGIKIHLHCFKYGRDEAKILNKYCYEVNYYPRKTGLSYHISSTPYIVLSRICRKVIVSIMDDDYPILCEGIHTCGLMRSPDLQNRKFIYRAANVEHDYYNALAAKEKNPFKKLYFKIEANKLKNYEEKLEQTSLILSISKADHDYYQNRFPNKKVENIFAFFNQDENLFPDFESKEKNILFHGNLSVHENNSTAKYIINELATKTKYDIIIAGKNPNKGLINLANRKSNVKIIANPDDDKMQVLIQKAHINLLLTDQATGLKLKLLNALFLGKFCLVNDNMLAGSQLQNCVEIGNTTEELLERIDYLMQQDFNKKEYEDRRKLIPEEFDNDYKSRLIYEWI